MGTVLVECISDSKNWNILEENTKIEGAEGREGEEGGEGGEATCDLYSMENSSSNFQGKREIDRLTLNYDILCNFWLFACADGSRGRTFSVPFTFLMPEMCIFKFRSNRVWINSVVD